MEVWIWMNYSDLTVKSLESWWMYRRSILTTIKFLQVSNMLWSTHIQLCIYIYIYRLYELDIPVYKIYIYTYYILLNVAFPAGIQSTDDGLGDWHRHRPSRPRVSNDIMSGSIAVKWYRHHRYCRYYMILWYCRYSRYCRYYVDLCVKRRANIVGPAWYMSCIWLCTYWLFHGGNPP